MSFPITNEELEPVSTVLVDRSLLQAACKHLRMLSASVDDQVLLNLEAILSHSKNDIRVVVEVRDGVINRLASNVKLHWVTQDDDIEGCDDDELVVRPGLDGVEEEVHDTAIFPSEVMCEQVSAIFEAIGPKGAL